jgi:PhnB protein
MVQAGTIFHRQVSLTARPSITYCVPPRSGSSLERRAVNPFHGNSTRLLVSLKESAMPKKIDPLNKKIYGAVTAMLTVGDVKAAAAFYQKAFGFTKRAMMDGPDGKTVHAELTLRGTTLMLGPEIPQMGSRSAKTIGASPASLYLLTEKVDKTVAQAVKLGATAKGPVMDMFWGDRCGTVVDPEGYTWMVATHVAEPTPQEMRKRMKEQMASQASSQAASAASGS